MPLIHSYTHGNGGLGDFLRSLFAYYVYCKIHEIPYYLFIKGHPFEFCFKQIPIPEMYLKDLKTFRDVGSSSDKQTEDILNRIKKENCLVISNKFDFIHMDLLKKHRTDFLKFLELTDPVNTRIKFLMNFYNLDELSFNSIHIRLGDKLMKNVNVASDIRIKDNTSFNNDFSLGLKFLRSNKPIVIFTDNTNLKNQLKINKTIKIDPHTVIDVTLLDTSIEHTALHNIDTISAIDTIAEFYIMGLSENIVTLSSSGFSFWSSFLFNRDLYRVSDGRVVPFLETDLKYK